MGGGDTERVTAMDPPPPWALLTGTVAP
jgi:hypothetical protein